jgi:hypothetical protein
VGRVVFAIAFAGALIITLMQHVQYATGKRPRHFLAFLETSGWLVITIAAGVALFRLAPGALWIGTGIVGAILMLIGSILRPADRA